MNFSHFVSITIFNNINNDVVSNHFAINFTFNLFENVIKKLSISFSKIVYIVFNNESNNKNACDANDVIVKKKILLIKLKVFRFVSSDFQSILNDFFNDEVFKFVLNDFQLISYDFFNDVIVFQNTINRIFENNLNTLENFRRSISKISIFENNLNILKNSQ